MILAVALLAAVPVASDAHAAPVDDTPVYARPVERRTEIGGRQYRVVTADKFVSIDDGDPAAPQNFTAVALRKTAVRRLTGCTMRSEYWDMRTLRGVLDCSNRALP